MFAFSPFTFHLRIIALKVQMSDTTGDAAYSKADLQKS